MIHPQVHIACDLQPIQTSVSRKHAVQRLIARGAVSTVLAVSLAAFPVAGAYAQDAESPSSKAGAIALQAQAGLCDELGELQNGLCQTMRGNGLDAKTALSRLQLVASRDLSTLLGEVLESSEATEITWVCLSGVTDAATAKSKLSAAYESGQILDAAAKAAFEILSNAVVLESFDTGESGAQGVQKPQDSTQSSAAAQSQKTESTSGTKDSIASPSAKQKAQAQKKAAAKKAAAAKAAAEKRALARAKAKAAAQAKAKAQAEAKRKAAAKKKAEAERKAARSIPNSGEYKPKHYTEDLTTEKFIALIGESARQLAQDHDLYASVLIAQAVLESDSGNSTLSKAPYFNLFGIKGAWRGQSVTMRTQEDDGTGQRFTISSGFRAYDSVVSSMEDYAQLLDGDFYIGAHKSVAKKPSDACDFLQGRYATATDYSHALQDLIETYDLTRFDKALSYQTVEKYQMPKLDMNGKAMLNKRGKEILERRDLTDVLNTAIAQLGADYVWGAEAPEDGFDCSGLIQYSFKTALGLNLPRVAEDQAKVGQTVKCKDLQPGDLLFFAQKDGYVYHVALYLGDGCYLHAPDKGDVVKVTSMDELKPSFAKRVVKTEPVKVKKAKHAKAKNSKTEEFEPKPVEVITVQPDEDVNQVIADVKTGVRS